MFKRLPKEIVDRLKKAGFVHITGLPAYRGDKVEIESIQCPQGAEGKHGGNNGKTVLYTQDGQVWLGTYDAAASDPDLIHELCPTGAGVYVPCSNGESPLFSHVLQRMVDPYSSIHGNYPARPKRWIGDESSTTEGMPETVEASR